MNSNLEKSKKKLIIIFTMSVFAIFLLIWLIFFSGKYFREVQIQKKDFINITNLYDFKTLDLDWLIKKLNTKILLEKKQKHHPNPNKIRDVIILDKNYNIIYNDIKAKISQKLLKKIIFSYENNKIINKEDFIIKKINLKNNSWIIIFIKKMHYSFFDYLKDIFWFLLLNIIFSILLYYISSKLINKVFVPVENNIKEMNEFIQNVWHELKTPLSVIDSNIQIINDIKKYDKIMVNELKNETLKINSIIDSLIKLTNLKSNNNLEFINLKNIINEILKEYSDKIKDKNIEIELLFDDDIKIYTNKNYFYIFLANIIWNSIKYNKKNWWILIWFNKNKLIIKDSWIWISKDNLNKIFNRFFKEDKSRNTEWFWIWLSLVKKIANINWWKIEVNSKKGEGTEFVIDFKETLKN